jgi:ADP-ribosylglycohydrolase
VAAVQGGGKDELVSPRYSLFSGCWDKEPLVSEIDKIARGSFKTRNPPEIRGTGYVVQSLMAALWAFHRTDNFREGCLAAVNLGDDADMTGAVFGQIAGAFYGYPGIPEAWRTRIALHDLIDSFARKLHEG